MEPRRSLMRIKQKRDLSLSVRNRSAITNLRRSSSSQLLPLSRKLSLHNDDFRFTGYDQNLLQNPIFKHFLSAVQCPVCLSVQSDKTVLIRHLEENCTTKIKHRFKPYAVFQIVPSNAIRCNVCPDVVLTSIESYFLHLHDGDHFLRRSQTVQTGKELTDLLHCASCKILVSNTYIQLQSHIENPIHGSRRKSSFQTEHSLRRSRNVFCIYNSEKQFKCLVCLHDFLFNTPMEIIDHLKRKNHERNTKNSNLLLSGVYCCFCDAEFSNFGIMDHFTSDEHVKNEKSGFFAGGYELCVYCGFTCSTSKELLTHMKLYCKEVDQIRQKKGQMPDKESKINRATGKNKISDLLLEKNQLILVKRDKEISKILTILKNFGEITQVKKYNDQYLIIEFENDTAVESILFVQNSVTICKMGNMKPVEQASKE